MNFSVQTQFSSPRRKNVVLSGSDVACGSFLKIPKIWIERWSGIREALKLCPPLENIYVITEKSVFFSWITHERLNATRKQNENQRARSSHTCASYHHATCRYIFIPINSHRKINWTTTKKETETTTLTTPTNRPRRRGFHPKKTKTSIKISTWHCIILQ